MSWLSDASANKIVQSYINNFMDVSGNFKVRNAETTGSSGTTTVDTSSASWTQMGSDIDSEVFNDRSGYSVSISSDGTILAIGAYGNDGNGSSAGHVRVYEYSGGSWSQLGSDIDGEAADDRSGMSVSLSSDGTILAIGAYGNDGNGSSAGHVRVYEYSGGSWSQLGSDIDGEAADDFSGWSVSLSSDGTILAVGARQAVSGTGAGTTGHVRVYEYSGGSWNQLGSDIDGEAAGDNSGWSVSLSSNGSIVAIGAVYNDGTGSNAGHVRVYEYSYSTWTQLGSDIDGEAAADYSGTSVALSSDGTIVAIGANENDGSASGAGHVRIYEYSGGSWSQLGSDIDGEVADDRFGTSVSLSSDGTIVAVGVTFSEDDTNTSTGHVSVYQYVNSTWNQIGSDIYGEAAWDRSGNSVSLSSNGSIVAIGAPFNDGNGSSAGHVRVYDGGFGSSSSSSGTTTVDTSSASWSQLGSDIEGEANNDEFGFATSLSSDGTILAVGGYKNDGNGNDSGHVRVYEYSGSSWSQLGSDIDGEAAGDQFGVSVSLSSDGTILAVGAYLNDGTGSNAGHVRVYEYSGGSWNQLGSDIDGEASNDYSGWWVSLSSDGTTVAISAIYNDGGGNNAGHVRVYQYSYSTWTQLGSDIDGEAAGDEFGFAISLNSDGTILAIGADHNDGNGTDSGHVRVYEYSGGSWSQLGSDIDGEAAGDQLSKVSLSSDGTILAVGGNKNDGGGSNSGHARVFEWNGSSWSQLGSDINGVATSDLFGTRLQLNSDGTILAVSAIFNDDGGTDSGHVRVFHYVNSTWTQIGSDIDGQAANERSGIHVSISSDGSIVAVGSDFNRSGAASSNTGLVRVYDGGFGSSASSSSGPTITVLDVSGGTVNMLQNTMDISSGVVDISGTTWINRGQSGATIAESYQGALIIESNKTSSSDAVLYVETTGQTQAFSIRGDGALYSDNALRHSSDDRRKINEQHITNAMETINKLSPQIYTKLNAFLENGGTSVKTESGLIAQEIYYNAPELRHLVTIQDENGNDVTPQEYDLSGNDIQNDPDYTALGWGTKSAYVDYTGLIPYLIKSNQEKQTILEQQETTISQQTTQIEDLKTRVTSLET